MWCSDSQSQFIKRTGIVLVTLSDNSTLQVDGDFITHFNSNLQQSRVRAFTVDTIPISIQSQDGGKISIQLVLAKTFQMIQHISLVQSTISPQCLDKDQPSYIIASTDEIFDTTVVDGLATLTAYTNGSVKAQFLDRTIVRMQRTSDWLKILNSRGEELTIRYSQL